MKGKKEKELRHLRRADLLRMLIDQSRENEQMHSRVAELEQQIQTTGSGASAMDTADGGTADSRASNSGDAGGRTAGGRTAGSRTLEGRIADESADSRSAGSAAQAVSSLEKELHRITYKKNFRRTLRSTIGTLITVAAISVLVATLFLPVLQIYGSSMTPTLTDGDIVISLKVSDFEQGDIVAFYYNNKVLVKRVIATGGEWVSVDEDGNVFVDGKQLDEPYVSELAYGECDIEFPYQVPEGKLFVMGDHRSVSVDSRSSTVGCVASEQIVGKLVFRIWPVSSFGRIE